MEKDVVKALYAFRTLGWPEPVVTDGKRTGKLIAVWRYRDGRKHCKYWGIPHPEGTEDHYDMACVEWDGRTGLDRLDIGRVRVAPEAGTTATEP